MIPSLKTQVLFLAVLLAIGLDFGTQVHSAETVVAPSTGESLSQARPSFDGQTSIDIGIVDSSKADEALHIFDLKNSSQVPIQVTGMRGSCGCEHLALLKDGKEQAHLTVLPGQSFQARMGVRLQGQPSGQITKSAWVVGGSDVQQRLIALTLSFTVRKPYAFEPERLDLGNVAAGNSASAMVTLKIDNTLDIGDAPLTLISDNPSITAAKIGNPQSVSRDGKPDTAITFRLTISNPSIIGAFHASLHPVSTDSNTSNILLNAFFPVSCVVIGQISVAPKAIYFGTVLKGGDMTRSILITGKSASDLQSLSVLSESPMIQVHTCSSDQVSSTSHVLTITLSGTVPAGPFETFLTVKSGNGQQVRVPVTADIINAP